MNIYILHQCASHIIMSEHSSPAVEEHYHPDVRTILNREQTQSQRVVTTPDLSLMQFTVCCCCHGHSLPDYMCGHLNNYCFIYAMDTHYISSRLRRFYINTTGHIRLLAVKVCDL